MSSPGTPDGDDEDYEPIIDDPLLVRFVSWVCITAVLVAIGWQLVRATCN